MTPEEFREAGHRLIDWIADYRANVSRHPVMARTEPGDVKQHAMGLLWEGDTLLAVVDNALLRFRIGPDGTTATGPPEIIRKIKATSDHHAHCLRRDPQAS